MKILAIVTNYPHSLRPHEGVFVQNTVIGLRASGHSVSVLKVVPNSQIIKYIIQNKKIKNLYSNDPMVTLPTYFGLPLTIFGENKLVINWNEKQMKRAVKKNSIGIWSCTKATAIYAHFYQSVRLALDVHEGNPIVAIMGESDPWLYDNIFGPHWVNDLTKCSAVIAVSQAGYKYYIERCPELGERLYFIPNAVDIDFFKPQSIDECRSKLGIDHKIKFAVFVGGFEERKGPLRALEAAQKAGCQIAFLGSGPQVPTGPEVIVARIVERNELLLWLGAANCFVLPSTSEGRSNAMLEALACGLPVVVSDLPFNTEFITSECGALVNGTSSDSIANGLRTVINSTVNSSMRIAARKVAETLSLKARNEQLSKIFESTMN